jgi:uncharacterized protein YjeT (DUF2065 family)
LQNKTQRPGTIYIIQHALCKKHISILQLLPKTGLRLVGFVSLGCSTLIL